MDERAFVIQQIGAKDSPERKRADEIYYYIVVPAVEDAALKPYRADLDLTPGAITPKMLSELLNARVVIADLTGRNPNVFYELGIAPSFARPLVSIADSSSSLPFDAKDERVIELGEYSASGLAFVQGQNAKDSLRVSLEIVLAENYEPPSPLRDVATNRSIDELAPKDPRAAEMAQIREALEDIRTKVTPRAVVPRTVREEISLLRGIIAGNVEHIDPWDLSDLDSEKASEEHRKWAKELYKRWEEMSASKAKARKELTGKDLIERELGVQVIGPVDDEPSGGYSDEPPF